ncbi:hypothetical protein D3C81_1778100 [compost metagenome]
MHEVDFRQVGNNRLNGKGINFLCLYRNAPVIFRSAVRDRCGAPIQQTLRAERHFAGHIRNGAMNATDMHITVRARGLRQPVVGKVGME